ncbi:hypothetical protein EBV26_15145, partial [bacterium]|nr:hypothetical protein [bacterium]
MNSPILYTKMRAIIPVNDSSNKPIYGSLQRDRRSIIMQDNTSPVDNLNIGDLLYLVTSKCNPGDRDADDMCGKVDCLPGDFENSDGSCTHYYPVGSGLSGAPLRTYIKKILNQQYMGKQCPSGAYSVGNLASGGYCYSVCPDSPFPATETTDKCPVTLESATPVTALPYVTSSVVSIPPPGQRLVSGKPYAVRNNCELRLRITGASGGNRNGTAASPFPQYIAGRGASFPFTYNNTQPGVPITAVIGLQGVPILTANDTYRKTNGASGGGATGIILGTESSGSSRSNMIAVAGGGGGRGYNEYSKGGDAGFPGLPGKVGLIADIRAATPSSYYSNLDTASGVDAAAGAGGAAASSSSPGTVNKNAATFSQANSYMYSIYPVGGTQIFGSSPSDGTEKYGISMPSELYANGGTGWSSGGNGGITGFLRPYSSASAEWFLDPAGCGG